MTMPSGRTWFAAVREPSNAAARIDIFDEIGAFGISARAFLDTLKGLGEIDNIALHINSPGGAVFDALAIYNTLKRHPAAVMVYIDGLAASAASLVAMAGDVVVMPSNAMLMIHNPWGYAMGDAAELRGMADVLDKLASSTAGVYADRSGLSVEEVTALMVAETWLTAEEALSMGLADQVEEPMKVAARFDLSRFAHPPQALALEAVPPPGVDDDPSPDPEVQPADPVTVAELCTQAGLPRLTKQLISAGLTGTEVAARLGSATAIREVFARAGKINPQIDTSIADDLIASGATIEAARSVAGKLIVAMQSPEIRNSHVPGGHVASGHDDHGWGAIVDRVNTRLAPA